MRLIQTTIQDWSPTFWSAHVLLFLRDTRNRVMTMGATTSLNFEWYKRLYKSIANYTQITVAVSEVEVQTLDTGRNSRANSRIYNYKNAKLAKRSHYTETKRNVGLP